MAEKNNSQSEPNFFQKLFLKRDAAREKIKKDVEGLGAPDDFVPNVSAGLPFSETVTQKQINEAIDQAYTSIPAATMYDKTLLPEDPNAVLDKKIQNAVAEGLIPQEKIDFIKGEISNGKNTLEGVLDIYQARQVKKRITDPKDPLSKSFEMFKKDFKGYTEEQLQNGFFNKFKGIIDSNIRDMVMADELPLDSEIVNRLKYKPEELPLAKQAYADYKKSKSFYAQPELVGDKIDAMRKAGFDMGEYQAAFEQEYSRPNYYFQNAVKGLTFGLVGKDIEPQYFTDEMAGPVVSFAASIPAFAVAEAAVGRILVTEIGGAVSGPVIRATGRIISKVAPELGEALSGVKNYKELVTGAQTVREASRDAFQAARAARTIGAAEEAAELYNAASKMRRIALGKDFVRLMGEQTVLGGGVGVAKGTKNYLTGEETLGEAVETALTEAIFFPLMAATLHGTSTSLGKAGMKIGESLSDAGSKAATKELNQFIKESGSDGVSSLLPSVRRRAAKTLAEQKAVFTSPQLQNLAKKGVSDNLILQVATTPKESLPLDSRMAVNAFEKLNIMKAAAGEAPVSAKDLTAAEILSKPALIKAGMVEDAKAAAKNMFLGENAPYRSIYESNPNIKALVDSGQNIAALDAVKGTMATYISQNANTVKDLIDSSLQVDADIINDVLAQKVLGSKRPSLTPEQKVKIKEAKKFVKESYADKTAQERGIIFESMKEKIIASDTNYSGVKAEFSDRKKEVYDTLFRYLDNPSPENTSALKEAVEAPKKRLSKKGTLLTSGKKRLTAFERLQDSIEKAKYSQLSAAEVNEVVQRQVQKNFSTLSEGRFTEGEVGGIMNSKDLIDSMQINNKQYMQTIFESFQENPNPDAFFGNLSGEQAAGVKTALSMRADEFELSLKVSSYNKTKGMLEDAIKNKEDKVVIENLKSLLKQNLTEQSSLRSNIRKSMTDLSAFNTAENPKGMEEITNKAADFWFPQRAIMRPEGTTAAATDALALGGNAKKEVSQISKQDFFNRLVKSGSREGAETGNMGDLLTPKYIRQGTALADEMTALLSSGKDISQSYTKVLSGGFLNASRGLAKEFGPNSAFSRFIVDGFKQREINATALKKKFMGEMAELGIKKGSVESKLIQMLGENNPTDFKSHPAFKLLSAAQQEKVAQGINFFRKTYNDLHNSMNTIHRNLGLPEIAFRDNYFPHFDDGEELSFIIGKYMAGDLDQARYPLQRVESTMGGKKTFFRHEFQRTGTDTVYDAVAGFEKYIDGATKRIHFSDYLKDIDTMMEFAPKKMREFLKNVKETKVLGVSNLDDVSFEPNSTVKKGIRLADQVYTQGTLAYKLSTVLSQLSSVGMNFFYAGKDGVKALYSAGTKEAAEILSKSQNLKIRNSHVAGLDAVNDGAENMLSKIIKAPVKLHDKFTQLGMVGVDIFDKVAAKHMYLSSFYKGKRMGLDEDAAHRLADYMTDKVHADLSKIGRASYQDSVLGRALTRFTTFTNNLFAGIITDLPRIEQTEGVAKGISTIMRMYASAEITNEVFASMGMPRPWDVSSFIPFIGTAKYGPTGVIALAGSAVKGVGIATGDVDSDRAKDEFNNNIKKQLWNILGISQGVRSLPAVQDLMNGKYRGKKSEFVKDFVVGQGARKFFKTKEKAEKIKDKKARKSKEIDLLFPRIEIKKKLDEVLP